jgi:peroxiredoxin
MNHSLLLLACACSLGQPTSRTEWQLTPQLAPGQELLYTGMYTEESLVPNVHFQRQYRLETLIFVLDAAARRYDVAVMTSLGEKAARPEPGSKEPRPASVRLELAKLDTQGRLRDGQGAMLLTPLGGPPTLEAGCFVEVPGTRLVKSSQWEVNEDSRPPRSWQVAGVESVNGVTCVKLIGQQQSLDWDRPRGDQTAWRRRDVIWLSPQLGVAQKVERTIERRDPLRRDPTHRSVVQYELTSPFRYPGRLFDDRKQEILKAKKFQDEATALLQQPAPNRPQLDGLIKRVSVHLEYQAPTPYRKAIVQLASRLDDAKNGKTSPNPVIADSPPPLTAVGLGQRVPDFVVKAFTGNEESVRLSRMLGRPVLVFFYAPAGQTGKEVVEYAKTLAVEHGDKLAIMPMAVTNDAQLVKKQHQELLLPFAILDGRAMHLTFGVDATPRVVLLDAEGIVRYAHTGWGAHVPRELQLELGQWLRK